MHRIVTFETDEQAEELARQLGVPPCVLGDCDSLTANIGGERFEITLDETGGWSLYCDSPVRVGIAALKRVYPDVEFISMLAASQELIGCLGFTVELNLEDAFD